MDSSFSLTIVVAGIGVFTLLGTIFFLFHRESRFHQENRTIPSSPTSLSFSRNWKHHVFPSFHGADVRRAFLSHVLKEFRSKGIDLFIDNDIERSKLIGPELVEAIRGSRIAIVLLSKNYASSTWCMDELVEIMKCREELGQTVITIFYEMDPTDVKKQTGYFGKVFRKTCKGKTKEVIGRWTQALTEIAKIAGYHSSNWDDEAAMIEKIATDISNKLNIATPSSDFNGLVGMGSHMERMQQLLRLDLDEVRMVGIWGPPGIGKSTIARVLFNQVSNNFQLRAIMVNIKGSYPSPCLDEGSAQLQLQNQMLSQMINHKDIMITHLGVAQERLKDKKVFLVLDDVDRLTQLDALAKKAKWFGPGSRIIITTEDLKLLKAHGINHIYKVDFPSDDEALQMFCMYAFGQKSPKDGFTELSREITYLVGKLPLGLKVMGSYFRGMSKEEWTRVLPKLWSRLDGEIESILKFSYDALCDEFKDLFLHIACFFNHEKMEKVEEHLERFLDVRQGLHVLTEKSLISIGQVCIKMHSLLVQLGKEIVRKQSHCEPGKRQFLVNRKDIGEVLTDPIAITRSVIGIYSSDTLNWDKLNISERAFEEMSNLQFLRLYGDLGHTNMESLLGRLKYISPKLQILDWKYSPMTCLPFIVNLEFLVELRMHHSKLEKLWDGIKLLRNLKWMDLFSSVNLKELPNLSTATNLQKLNLSGCSSLVKLPSSIGNATGLQTLNLSECSSIVELPSSLGDATNLQELHLNECSKLEVLPTNINLESLIKLNLTNCSLLKSFPEISTNIKSLYLIGTAIKEVPPSISFWPHLKELTMSYYENLKGSPHAFNSITELHLTNTEIQEIGPWVKGCSGLVYLVLNGCRKLVSLPQLPDSLKLLCARNCKSLERLDCSLRNPNIYCLNFENCLKLNEEARDLIIQTPTSGYSLLPGGEVPACFTYRAFGSSLTVELNEKPLRTSMKFKACILLDYKGKDHIPGFSAECILTSKLNSVPTYINYLKEISDHLYIFNFEAKEVTSTELVFEFELKTRFEQWEIKECGILQLW